MSGFEKWLDTQAPEETTLRDAMQAAYAAGAAEMRERCVEIAETCNEINTGTVNLDQTTTIEQLVILGADKMKEAIADAIRKIGGAE